MTQICCQEASPSSEQRCRIQKIAALTPCRGGLVCLTSRFQSLGRLEATEQGRAMKCPEPAAARNLGVPFQGGTYCACLLRLYIAKTFDR